MSGEDLPELQKDGYGLGDVVVVVELLVPGAVFIVVFDSVLLSAGEDLSITVVLLSVFFSPGGLVTVVSFCSQAARKAMLNNRQMYFMLFLIRSYSANCASMDSLMVNSLLLWWWSCPRSLDSKPWSTCRWDLLRGLRFQFFAHSPRATRRQLKCR